MTEVIEQIARDREESVLVPAQRVVRLEAPLELGLAPGGAPRAELVRDGRGGMRIHVWCRCGEPLVLNCEFEETR